MKQKEEVLSFLKGVVVDKIGRDEEACTEQARLFEDLGFESIDLLEISRETDNEFGFCLPAFEFSAVITAIVDDATRGVVDAALDTFNKIFLTSVSRLDLSGYEHLRPEVIRAELRELITLGFLADFIVKKLEVANA